MFALLSFALYQLSPSEIRTARRDKTLTEAHFACTAGIRNIKEWIAAVCKPTSDSTAIEYLGDNWASRTVKAGSTSYQSVHNEPFSVPSDDPNFNQVALADLKCPYNHFGGKTGIEFLGLRPDVNLLDADYNYIKGQQSNWLALQSAKPLTVGDYQVYTFVIPSANTLSMLTGKAAPGLRTFLVTTVAYKDGQPVMRSRCLLKEKSAADYAYRSNISSTDVMGNPVEWKVVDANTVLFDGPVHTNDTPYVSVPSTYWDAALKYDPLDKKQEHPFRAFMGTLTFSGPGTKLDSARNFDGVGWKGANYGGGTNTNNAPFDDSGNPRASSAQGANNDPATGKINNRYDRLVEGGRSSISKIASVPLPADVVGLKSGAYGEKSVTGLDPGLVNNTQEKGSLQKATVDIPAYVDKDGKTVKASTKTNTSDYGIFVNTKSGATEVAGGVVVKGNVRNMILEVTDANGNIVSDVASLEAGSATGNPTVRVQATTTSYDSDSGDKITSYKNVPTTGADTWIDAVPDKWIAPVDPVAGYTVTGKAGYTKTGKAGFTTKGKSPLHDPVSTCPAPTVTGPTGGGAGASTYSCPHKGTDTWTPKEADTWVDKEPDTWVKPVAGKAGYTQAGKAGYTAAGTKKDNWVEDTSKTILKPYEYKAQDWVVDAKNTSVQIPLSVPNPDYQAWKYGAGSTLSDSSSNAHAADVISNADGGLNKIFIHDGADDITGTSVTDTGKYPDATSRTFPKGSVLLYKQSRSDANRVDIFVLKRPSDKTVAQQASGLNGAVFGTGDISGLRGVNMDAKTIGADYGDGTAAKMKGISIADNVWQFGTARGKKPVNALNGLGLVAPKMNVQTDEKAFVNTNTKLYVYATIIAGSAYQDGTTGNPYWGMEVSRSDNNDTTNWGLVASSTDTSAASRTLQIIGGLTEQQTKARIIGSRGWSQSMSFDVELSRKPPPFFPSANVLVPLAFTQESVIGQ